MSTEHDRLDRPRLLELALARADAQRASRVLEQNGGRVREAVAAAGKEAAR